MDRDYISVDVKGTVTSIPERKGKNYFFDLQNKRDNAILNFKVFVRNDERPISIFKDDEVLILKAGFYKRDGNDCLVVEGNNIEAIRKRYNQGEREV